MAMFKSLVMVALSLTFLASAHPGEKFDQREHMDELANAHVVAEVNARALEACQSRPDFIARKERAVARRAETFERLLREKGLDNGRLHCHCMPKLHELNSCQKTSSTAGMLHRFVSGRPRATIRAASSITRIHRFRRSSAPIPAAP